MAAKALRYLESTKDRCLILECTKQDKGVVMYTDASFRQLSSGKPICAYLIYVNGTLVAWGAKSMKSNPMSTFEAEIAALKMGIRRCRGIHKLAKGLDLVKQDSAVKCLVDNNLVVLAVMNQQYNGKGDSTYLMGAVKFLQSEVADKAITVEHIGKDNMIADIMTKGMNVRVFDRLLKMIPMADEPDAALPGLRGSVNFGAV